MPKYYIIKLNNNTPEYIKDTEDNILEYDSEKEVREALRGYKKAHIKSSLCWKKGKLKEEYFNGN